MASLNSWLSVGVMHALGWALIHSLWQCLGVAALAACLMALSRRPSLRYLVAVGALTLMLAVPVATFFVLLRSPAPVHAFLPPRSGSSIPAATGIANVPAVALPIRLANGTVLENFPRSHPSPGGLPSPYMLPWLVGAWLCGVAFFSLRFAGGFLLLEHRYRRQSTAPAPRILALCRALQRELGLNRTIRYLECSWLQTPAVIGWIRPILLLPVCALCGLTEEQLRAVIAHELAHIRRLDMFVNLFQILVETLLFYHPAMWWLNRRIRIERELCCDEIAVALTGNRLEYARALTRMAEWKNAPVLAMAANRGPLSLRILHILGGKPSGAGQRMMGLAGGLVFLMAALAAANTLFGIAYPIPMAHATENVTLSVADDHAVRQTLQATALKDAAPAGDATGQDAAQTRFVQNSQPEKLVPPSPAALSRLLPNQTLATPTVVASNDTRPGAPGSTDQPAAPLQPTAHDPGPVQVASNAPPATPQTAGLNATPTACSNTKVFALVVSPNTIRLPGFACFTGDKDGVSLIKYGTCPLAGTDLNTSERGCRFDLTMKVRFADPADAFKMKPGRIMRLSGDFRVAADRPAADLSVENARVLEVDPLGLLAPMLRCEPSELTTLSQRLDRRLCVQNDIVANLNLTAPALEAAASSPVHDPKATKPSNDPDAITCRQSGIGGWPLVNCAYNSYWAWADRHPKRPRWQDGPYSAGNEGNSSAQSGGLVASGVTFVW